MFLTERNKQIQYLIIKILYLESLIILSLIIAMIHIIYNYLINIEHRKLCSPLRIM